MVLRKIEARGTHETAARTRVLLSQIFRFGIGNGLCKRDAAADLKGVLTAPISQNMKRVELEELPALLIAIDGCEGARWPGSPNQAGSSTSGLDLRQNRRAEESHVVSSLLER